MTIPPYIDSYYRQTMINRPTPASLHEKVEADVCVVGGGLAGLTAARELLKLGKSVILVEGNQVGWGASGRNGGFVADGYARGIRDLEDRLGVDHAKALFEVSQQGTNYVRQTIAQLGALQSNVQEGWLRVLRYSDEDHLRREVERMVSTYGASWSFWNTHQVRDVLVTERYFQGIEDPDAFHIQPLNYALALAKDIRSLGGLIFEGSPARRLDCDGKAWRVVTPAGGEVRCGSVLLCGSAYMHDLHPKLERAVLPVATYVIASELMKERLHSAVRYLGCIGDTRRAGDYYRIVDDASRLIWGGRITTRRAEPEQLGALLQKDILSIYPQLGDFKIDYAWSGLMGYSIHKMPILRELEPGLWSATATGGHGLNTTASIGMLAAEGIAKETDRYKLFEPFKAQWGGGPIGRAATQLAYWGLQAQDWWDEVRR